MFFRISPIKNFITEAEIFLEIIGNKKGKILASGNFIY